MNNWLSYFLNALQYVPVVATGVEALHKGAMNGASKKQLALGALGLAASQIQNFVPTEYQAMANGAANLAAQALDMFVQEANADPNNKLFAKSSTQQPQLTEGTKPAATTPAPTPVDVPSAPKKDAAFTNPAWGNGQ